MSFYVYDPDVGFLSDIRHVCLSTTNTSGNGNGNNNNHKTNTRPYEPLPNASPRTQASKLPQSFNHKLDAIEQLKGRQNYETWAIYVEAQLRLCGLEDLINPSMPRPVSTDPKFEMWKKHSLRVKNWLFLQLSTEIVSDLLFSYSTSSSNDSSNSDDHYKQYADEVWNAIKSIVVGNGLYDGNANADHSKWVNSVHRHNVAYSTWTKALNTKRENFASIDQFVSALKRRVQESNRLNMPITPYQAASLLLQELRNELPSWTVAVQISFKDNIATAMREKDFWDLCRKAQNQARIMQNERPVTKIARRQLPGP